MTVQISRDPFARSSLVRQVDKTEGESCRWCGATVGLGVSRLFRYGTEHDARPNVDWENELFCGKSCHDSYHS